MKRFSTTRLALAAALTSTLLATTPLAVASSSGGSHWPWIGRSTADLTANALSHRICAPRSSAFGVPVVITMGLFVGMLFLGFIYVWKKGALEWE